MLAWHPRCCSRASSSVKPFLVPDAGCLPYLLLTSGFLPITLSLGLSAFVPVSLLDWELPCGRALVIDSESLIVEGPIAERHWPSTFFIQMRKKR